MGDVKNNEFYDLYCSQLNVNQHSLTIEIGGAGWQVSNIRLITVGNYPVSTAPVK